MAHRTHKSTSAVLSSTAGIVLLAAIAGCAVGSSRELDEWRSTESDHCQSVVFGFTADRAALAEIVGNNAVPADVGNGSGRLNVALHLCGTESPEESPAQARVTVALDGQHLPIQLAGSTSWNAYVLHMSNEESATRRKMAQSGFAVLRASVWLTVETIGSGVTTRARLTFVNGEVELAANFDGVGERFDRRGMLIGTGRPYAVLAGWESGLSTGAETFSFSNKGITPFSDLNPVPAYAEFLTDYQWDYTVWRNVAVGRSH